MADAECLLKLLERGVGMLLDVDLKFLRVEFAPVSPACLGGQRPRCHGGQIAVNGAPTQFKAPGRLGLGAAVVDEFDHPLPQIQRISFHALKPTSLCANVNMKYYTPRIRPLSKTPQNSLSCPNDHFFRASTRRSLRPSLRLRQFLRWRWLDFPGFYDANSAKSTMSKKIVADIQVA